MEGDGAALARGHVLVGVEAVDGEDRAGVGADLAAAVVGAHGLGGVLHHPEAVGLGDPPDRVHGRREPGEVHRDDALGAGGDGRLEPGRVEFRVAGSMSTSTGTPPWRITVLRVETQVRAVVMTSSRAAGQGPAW